MEPETQENRRGIRRVPLHTIGDPLAVRRQTMSSEEDLGPGNTETEALESTRNSWSERMSFRKRRVKVQNSSGAESTGGQVGWTGVSTCRTTCFPKRNKVSCGCWPFHHVFVKPTESGRSRRSGRQSWSQRTLGKRRILHGERRRLHGERWRLHGDRRPWGAGGQKVHLQVF